MRVRREENAWPFTSREIPASNLKSPWSIGRANEEAEKAGYKGEHTFREWLRLKKLDDRSQGQIRQLGASYDSGVAREHEDAVAKHRGKAAGKAASELEEEVASALVNYGMKKGEAQDAARQAVKGGGGGGFDEVFKRALKMTTQKSNPAGYGTWEEFNSDKAAKQYARLMEGQGKIATRHRGIGGEYFVKVETPGEGRGESNPARSAQQYRLAQAVLSGTARGSHMPVSVAREIVEKTPHRLRSQYSRNPSDVEVRDMKLDKEGYDKDGRYWGAGQKVWYYVNDYDTNGYVRASSAVEAKRKAIAELKRRGFGSELTQSKSNPESTAADMYESFHGAPSEQLVTFEEQEHYHEYLAELGVCCGVLVETEQGAVQAIGLSGYVWKGKGKDAGFVSEYETRSNPRLTKKERDYGVPRNYELLSIRKSAADAQDVADALRHAGLESKTVAHKNYHGDFMYYGVWTNKASWKSKVKLAEDAYFGRHPEKLKQNPKRHRGPFRKASDLILGGAGQLDDALGDVLTGKNPPSFMAYYPGKSPLEIWNETDEYEAKKRAADIWKLGSPLGSKASKIRIRKVTDGESKWHPHKGENPSDPIDPNTTLLSSNEDGTQLYLVGGDQSLDLDALGITGDCATKELITIGDVVKVHYETEKDFDKFETIQYHHELGEETGELPVLAYDRMNQRLLFIGGAYRIEKPLMETSPGIEN